MPKTTREVSALQSECAKCVSTMSPGDAIELHDILADWHNTVIKDALNQINYGPTYANMTRSMEGFLVAHRRGIRTKEEFLARLRSDHPFKKWLQNKSLKIAVAEKNESSTPEFLISNDNSALIIRLSFQKALEGSLGDIVDMQPSEENTIEHHEYDAATHVNKIPMTLMGIFPVGVMSISTMHPCIPLALASDFLNNTVASGNPIVKYYAAVDLAIQMADIFSHLAERDLLFSNAENLTWRINDEGLLFIDHERSQTTAQKPCVDVKKALVSNIQQLFKNMNISLTQAHVPLIDDDLKKINTLLKNDQISFDEMRASLKQLSRKLSLKNTLYAIKSALQWAPNHGNKQDSDLAMNQFISSYTTKIDTADNDESFLQIEKQLDTTIKEQEKYLEQWGDLQKQAAFISPQMIKQIQNKPIQERTPEFYVIIQKDILKNKLQQFAQQYRLGGSKDTEMNQFVKTYRQAINQVQSLEEAQRIDKKLNDLYAQFHKPNTHNAIKHVMFTLQLFRNGFYYQGYAKAALIEKAMQSIPVEKRHLITSTREEDKAVVGEFHQALSAHRYRLFSKVALDDIEKTYKEPAKTYTKFMNQFGMNKK